MIREIGQLTVKMVELMEAEGRVAKSELHQMIKAFTLYMVSGILCVVGIIVMAAGFFELLRQVMAPGTALLVGAMMLITISVGISNYASNA